MIMNYISTLRDPAFLRNLIWGSAEIEIVTTTGFEGALAILKQGNKISRKGWNGKGMWLQLQVPDEHSKMTLPYIYIEYPVGSSSYPQGCKVPWLANQTDILAEDWVTIT